MMKIYFHEDDVLCDMFSGIGILPIKSSAKIKNFLSVCNGQNKT